MPEPTMRLVTSRAWPLFDINTRAESGVLPPGEHAAELRPYRTGDGRDIRWLCLKGQDLGASLGSWLQWSPGMKRPDGTTIDWKDCECRVYDQAGRLLGEDGRPIEGPSEAPHESGIRYALSLTATQAGLLVRALDLFSRIGMGQLGDVAQYAAPGGLNATAYRHLKDELIRLERLVSPDGTSACHYSISSPEIDDANRVAWDMQQVIRHRLAWDGLAEGDTPSGVSFYEPMRYSAEPLPAIAKVEDAMR